MVCNSGFLSMIPCICLLKSFHVLSNSWVSNRKACPVREQGSQVGKQPKMGRSLEIKGAVAPEAETVYPFFPASLRMVEWMALGPL